MQRAAKFNTHAAGTLCALRGRTHQNRWRGLICWFDFQDVDTHLDDGETCISSVCFGGVDEWGEPWVAHLSNLLQIELDLHL